MTSLIKKKYFCNNCGRSGHLFHQCKIPITSIGIISIRKNNSNIEVLLVRRKDSLSFVDFIRGKYILEDKEYIINLFNRMTISEKNYILNNDFNVLWNYLWGNNINSQYKNEEKISKNKFNQLKNGVTFMNDFYNVESIIELCYENYEEPEWGFPKGRRNYQERDIMCGFREFEEETGYEKSDIVIFNNVLPFDEVFTGSNYKSYKHKYFIGYMNNNSEPKNSFQKFEISKIEWVQIDKSIDYIRNYNVEKKKILLDLIKLLKTYKLYI